MKKNVVFVVLGILSTCIIILILNLETILKERLNSLLILNEDRNYNYSFDELQIDLIQKKIRIKQLEMMPRSVQVEAGKLASAVDLSIEEFVIEDIHIAKLIFFREFEVENIKLLKPRIKVHHYPNIRSKDIEDPVATKAMFSNVISENIRSITIQSLQIVNAETEIFEITSDSLQLLHSKNTSIEINGIYTNNKILRSNEIFSFESSKLELNDATWFGLEDYVVRLGSFESNTSNDLIKLKAIRLEPRSDKFSFMSKQLKEKDWFNCSVEELDIMGLDIDTFQRERKLHARLLLLEKVDIEIYRDKRKPDQLKKYKALPSRLLRTFDYDVKMDSIELRNSKIRYSEFEIDAVKPLTVFFENTNLTIQNFISKVDATKPPVQMNVTAESSFMGEGDISLKMSFQLNDTNDSFTSAILLSNIPMPSLNPILSESAFIKFNNGTLNRLEYELVGNDIEAETVLNIDYNGLTDVSLLRKRSQIENNKSREKKFLSYIISKVIPESYNRGSEYYHQGTATFQRNRNKSFFNYLVEGLKEGMMDCILGEHEMIEGRVRKDN